MSKTQEFIQKAIAKHGNKYDYSLVDYIHSKQYVNINCFLHSIFKQTPNNHLKGAGCPSCGAVKLNTKLSDFISSASKVHHNLYDYSLVNYKNTRTKIDIICKNHGVFKQTPTSHLQGHGCVYCAKERTITSTVHKYKNTPTQFYIIKYKGLYKVGITVKDVYKRYKYEVDDYNDIDVITIKYFNGYKSALDFEGMVKRTHKEFLYTGTPIFKNTGNTEVFTYIDMNLM